MRVFAQRAHSFRPSEHPFATFRPDGSRGALLAASAPGDLLVIVGTEDKPMAVEDRGRLLGIVEFGRIPIDLKEIARDAFSEGLRYLRAWSFAEPRFKLLDTLREQLAYQAINRA